MDKEKERRIEINKESIDFYPMSIIRDKKQVSVRIPKEVVDAIEIDTKKDIFVFAFDKKDLTLTGSLEDARVWENAVKENQEKNG